ncbi:hypothetical protein K2173_024519 [Erythroxylum novogranatense]|uniref:Regulator of Vps4 activity in the MVB pathway protein n=1 Tax=Erythroxylum novogranatense TaxID=1862640 RepID=A0AAV8SVC4_9ROSI|nr:hypothetical protein K2173_024519 [Erythroxylum novogranatense]
MFSGFSKHKFYTKCKSSMKTMKCRMEVLKKKKNTVAKYLKNDMADLIRNGFDYNAYCRAEGLMVELKIIEAYDLIEKFCGCISNHLSAMNNQRECPEECKEAVQSLIYATARVPEFPELKNLRTLFNDRYGTSEKLVNKEFMEKLNPKSATKDMKFQLMHDIAQEFSVEWNPKSLEQELFKAPLTRSSTDQEDLREHESPENGHKLDENPKMDIQKGTKEGEEREHELTKIRNESFSRRYGLDFKSRVEKVKVLFLSKRNETEAPSGARKIGVSEDYTTSSSLSSLKTEAENAETDVEESLKSSSSNGETQQDDSDVESKPKPRSVRRRPSNLSKYQALEETFSVESPLKRASGTENSNDVEKPLKPPLKRASGPENLNGVCGTRSPRATKSDKFEPEQRKTHARAASDMTRRYVHPNLPDCDELADRISFLKGI